LNIEIHKTQQAFRNRLDKEDIQTLIIKAVSKFDGDYFFASKRGSVRISDEYRPFYIIFLGRTEFLNELLTEKSIGSKIETTFETARFFVNEERNIPYQVAPSVKRIGSFKLDFKDNYHLNDAELSRENSSSQLQPISAPCHFLTTIMHQLIIMSVFLQTSGLVK